MRRWAATRPRPRCCRRCSSELDERRLAATFFVEGLNAELYPELLREIDAARPRGRLPRLAPRAVGRAVGAAEQAANLARGHRRLRAARPAGSPGCARRAAGSARAAAASCVRPACATAPRPGPARASTDGVALLPFRVAPRRRQLRPAAAGRGARADRWLGRPGRARLPSSPGSIAEIERLAEAGRYMSIVLHPFMLDWLGEEPLAALLDRVAAARPVRRSGSRAAPRSPSTCSPIRALRATARRSTRASWAG